MTTYQLTLTKKQAQTIQAACELYERLHAGQWFALEDILPLKEGIYWHNLEPLFKNMIEPYCDANKMRFERVAGDIMQVIRHHLAWEDRPEGGDTVNFRIPVQLGNEPLAKMENID